MQRLPALIAPPSQVENSVGCAAMADECPHGCPGGCHAIMDILEGSFDGLPSVELPVQRTYALAPIGYRWKAADL